MDRLNEKVVKRILASFRGILQQKPAWNVSPNLSFSNKRGIQRNSLFSDPKILTYFHTFGSNHVS